MLVVFLRLPDAAERLSSGLRINRPSDDPAGLAVLSKVGVNTRVYSQAIRNANDGVSALTIADSTVDALTQIVTRVRELATQAANGALGITQRQSLDSEAQALRDEYTRIIQSTQFNGISLLDGSAGSGLNLQLGFGNG